MLATFIIIVDMKMSHVKTFSLEENKSFVAPKIKMLLVLVLETCNVPPFSCGLQDV